LASQGNLYSSIFYFSLGESSELCAGILAIMGLSATLAVTQVACGATLTTDTTLTPRTRWSPALRWHAIILGDAIPRLRQPHP
jgi:hypothetical protein